MKLSRIFARLSQQSPTTTPRRDLRADAHARDVRRRDQRIYSLERKLAKSRAVAHEVANDRDYWSRLHDEFVAAQTSLGEERDKYREKLAVALAKVDLLTTFLWLSTTMVVGMIVLIATKAGR